ncbi:hypothetical protein F4859DRAFT_482406 [Xylaria cf. heliscus]|nr:hypothetical protein F4859DRAFT_482406 [Xylaria cf. heliscus]
MPASRLFMRFATTQVLSLIWAEIWVARAESCCSWGRLSLPGSTHLTADLISADRSSSIHTYAYNVPITDTILLFRLSTVVHDRIVPIGNGQLGRFI